MAIHFSGAREGQQDEEDKPKCPLSTQTVPGGGKENVARNDETVPVRGEPEGESKQPVVTVQRQVRCMVYTTQYHLVVVGDWNMEFIPTG